jgi:hypothetical protein
MEGLFIKRRWVSLKADQQEGTLMTQASQLQYKSVISINFQMEVAFFLEGRERIRRHIKKWGLMDKLLALLDHKLTQMDQIRN